VLKGRVPRLFGNVLRLDHLDVDSARAAILEPLAELEALGGPRVVAEPALVTAVVDQVASGRIERRLAGRGIVPGAAKRGRVEAPYLQLVMERLWEVERERRSNVLKAATLAELGGAGRIVQQHLERALATLAEPERELVARLFNQLVTPSGTKIAHAVEDLSRYADAPPTELEDVLHTLASERVVRALPARNGGGARYEIYHDVLAAAVLDWGARHEAERALAEEREAARRRHRRLAAIVGLALVALALMGLLTVYAFAQRREAQQQAELAQAQQANAERSAAEEQEAREESDANAQRAEVGEAKAKASAASEKEARERADRKTAEAEQQRNYAQAERDEARRQRQRADRATADAKRLAASESVAKEDALASRNDALASRNEAVRSKNDAIAERNRARRATERERRATEAAVEARRRAQAGELVARSISLLNVDPEQSLALALQSGRLEPTNFLEGALRDGLTATRAQRVFAGGGGSVEAAAVGPGGGSGSAARALREAGAADSTDARVLVASAEGEARVFERGSGKLVVRVQHGAPITDAVLAPDGASFVTGGRDGVARRWDARTGAPLGQIEHGPPIRKLAISPDGRLLVTAAGEAARVWLAADGSPVARLPQPFSVDGVSFNPSGTLLLTQARDARVYETSDFRRPPVVLDQPGVIVTARFAPIGDLVATGGRDDIATIWDSRTGERRHQLAHRGDVTDLAWSPSADLLATSSTDNGGRVFRADTGALVTFLGLHSNQVVGVAFSPDGAAIATASLDGSARIWSGDGFSRSAALLGHRGQVLDVAFASDGTGVLTVSTDGSARMWKPAVDPILKLVGRHSATGRSVAVSRDGLIASVGLDNTLRVWRRNGSVVRTIPHRSQLVDVSFSKDGRLVLTAGQDGVARIWRLADGIELQSFGQEAPLRSADFDASGQRVVTGGADGIARIWRRAGGPPRELRHGGGAVVAAVFSPDGRFVATAGEDAEGRVWRAATGKLLGKLVGQHEDDLTSIAYSPDGKLLATSSIDADAHIWNAETFAWVRALRGHTAVVGDVAFSPDGRWIATAGPTTVGIWEARTRRRIEKGTPVFFLRGHGPRVRSVTFAPDSRRVASVGDDGAVRTYLCELCGTTQELMRFAQRRLDRLGSNLTPEERRNYIGG
jgi:WD40 repeat protein